MSDFSHFWWEPSVCIYPLAAARAVLKALADGQISPADAESALKVIDGWKQVQGSLEDKVRAEHFLGNIINY